MYHKDKLKFYSCKDCGENEYYICCGVCGKCSRGCIITKHVSKDIWKNK